MTKAKGDHTLTAAGEVWTHAFGWELRLMIDGHGTQVTSVVRSGREMLETIEQWRAAMTGERLELMPCHCPEGWVCEHSTTINRGLTMTV